jgi:phosphate uptake regulator
MDFRKIIEFGKGSYIVTLPKPWVINNKLKKGSILSLDYNENSIVISTGFSESDKDKKIKTINADNKKIEEIETEIVTSYLTGNDTIEIYSKRMKEIGEEIKKRIMNLAGMEILEQTATRITAKYLLDINEISLDSLVRRMDNITRSLVIDAMDCLNGSCNYLSIKQRDMDVNRLHFLVLRTVQEAMDSTQHLRKGGKAIWEIYSYSVLSEKLEKVADRQKRIARGLEELKLSKSFALEIKKVYDDINSSYLTVMKAYYQNDKKSALKIELSNKSRLLACDSLLGKDIKREYTMIKKDTEEKLMVHVHEHMIITEVISNLKAMAASVKRIARLVMNNEA